MLTPAAVLALPGPVCDRPKSGRVFLVTGDYTEIDPNAKDPRKRFAVKPGSTRMLLVDTVP
jgi:hypothetical protein